MHIPNSPEVSKFFCLFFVFSLNPCSPVCDNMFIWNWPSHFCSLKLGVSSRRPTGKANFMPSTYAQNHSNYFPNKVWTLFFSRPKNTCVPKLSLPASSTWQTCPKVARAWKKKRSCVKTSILKNNSHLCIIHIYLSARVYYLHLFPTIYLKFRLLYIFFFIFFVVVFLAGFALKLLQFNNVKKIDNIFFIILSFDF